MTGRIKSNVAGDANAWVQGENNFATEINNDWNAWNFSYLGLDGKIETLSSGSFMEWTIPNSDITVTALNSAYNSWSIEGEERVVSLSTTNWNTWVINGDLVCGISTTVTDDFNEWEIHGGDWSQFSPQFRAATVFISVISSSVLRDL